MSAGGAGVTLDERLEAAKPFLDVLDRVRVGEADVALAVGAERGARKRGDARFLEERAFHLRARHPEGAYVREDVEGPRRLRALDARNGIEPGHDRLAAPAELRHHGHDL